MSAEPPLLEAFSPQILVVGHAMLAHMMNETHRQASNFGCPSSHCCFKMSRRVPSLTPSPSLLRVPPPDPPEDSSCTTATFEDLIDVFAAVLVRGFKILKFLPQVLDTRFQLRCLGV